MPGSISVDESAASTEAFDDDAAKIVSLSLSAKKEDSGSLVFTDGEKMPF
jgi:hypothetical protein